MANKQRIKKLRFLLGPSFVRVSSKVEKKRVYEREFEASSIQALGC